MSDNKIRGRDRPSPTEVRGALHDESHVEVLRELVAHLRQSRTQLREVWASATPALETRRAAQSGRPSFFIGRAIQ